MCTLTFHLPAGLQPEVASELERACLAGGPDNMPYATQASLHTPGQLVLTRQSDESGYLAAPWLVPGVGRLMGTSATLMQRTAPYNLLVELARGKVNQVRCQAADWETGGLQVPASLREHIHRTSLVFGRAVCGEDLTALAEGCQQALGMAYQGASDLVGAYVQQVFHIRHQRHEQLETALSCRLDRSVNTPAVGDHLKRLVNRVSLPLSWHVIEEEETAYRWAVYDELLEWAEANELDVTAGPLIDFSSSQLPSWLWLWNGDLPSMATFMCRFVEATVRRYRARIRRWQLTAGSNWANVLGLTEEELLGLTFRLGEAARGVDPSLELVLGISQPWGEYMIPQDHTSPFIFADNLIRSGLNLSAINLEIVMGVRSRGSYCRDLLEVSRLLDLYALLGVPLQVTLGYPAGEENDPEADPELTLGAGMWREGYQPGAQRDWAASMGALALCKPFVQAVQWTHFSDAQPHLFPNCGLVDLQGRPRPAMGALLELREQHLR